ncbi:MAG: DnaJ domain-containing protein [Chloroflexia bacterium]|nr:DnaJ domain-containing protein [Chloroflexia bacterium]
MPAVQFKDYYQTLGVERGADEKAVRTAFRTLARKHHPDLNPGDAAAEERFKEINEAFEVLTDAEKRKLYDRFGEDWQRYRDAGFTGDEPAGRPGGARGGADPNDFGAWYSGQTGGSGAAGTGGPQWTTFTAGDGDDAEGFSDFFQTLFGSRGDDGGRARTATSAQRRSRPRRGEDIEVAVEVSFDEAFRGAKRTLQLQAPEICPTCGGAGYVRESPCPTCDGTGVSARTRTLEVTIPPGVATGSRVRIAGQGGAGDEGGPKGDVYLLVTVRPDARFEREGDNLRTEVDVPVATAALGGETAVTTPTGRVALTIPAETQAGRVFRLRGQGMPKLKGPKGERGDLLARARIVVPTRLTERERELFAELRQLRPEGA